VLVRTRDGAPLLGDVAPRFACSCSRDKVGAMLQMLGPAEVESILAERETIEVRCEFCNLAYGFDAVDAARLFVAGDTHGAPPRAQ